MRYSERGISGFQKLKSSRWTGAVFLNPPSWVELSMCPVLHVMYTQFCYISSLQIRKRVNCYVSRLARFKTELRGHFSFVSRCFLRQEKVTRSPGQVYIFVPCDAFFLISWVVRAAELGLDLGGFLSAQPSPGAELRDGSCSGFTSREEYLAV